MKIVCENCKHLNVKKGEKNKCWSYITMGVVRNFYMNENYVNKRLNGEKKDCKEFKLTATKN